MFIIFHSFFGEWEKKGKRKKQEFVTLASYENKQYVPSQYIEKSKVNNVCYPVCLTSMTAVL